MDQKRCLSRIGSGLPQIPYEHCTEPEGHTGDHVATDLRTGEVVKSWSDQDELQYRFAHQAETREAAINEILSVTRDNANG